MVAVAQVAPLVEALDRLLEADLRRRKARSTARLERRLRRSLARAWRIQGDRFLAALAALATRFAATESRSTRLLEAIREDEWLPLFDAASLETLELFIGPLSLQTQAAILAGTKAGLADLRVIDAFDLEDPVSIEILRTQAATMVAGLDETTRDVLRTLIADGIAQGKSYSAIAADIRRTFEGFATRRAELVAVTEIGDAYEFGHRGVAERLARDGLDMEKQWLDVGDRRVDPVCASNAAEGWIPLDAPFGSGHQQPTAHPGCRCTTQYRRRPRDLV